MENCYVIKLKASISNDNLPKLGDISLAFSATADFMLKIKNLVNDFKVSIIDEDGEFVSPQEAAGGKVYTFPKSVSSYTTMEFNAATHNVVVADKYNISAIESAYFSGDIGIFKYSPINTINLGNTTHICSGNLSDLSHCQNIALYVDENFYGTVDDVPEGLKNLAIRGIGTVSNITGDIADIDFSSYSTSNLALTRSKISGSINDITIPHTCRIIEMYYNQNLEGDVETFIANNYEGKLKNNQLSVNFYGTGVTYNGATWVTNVSKKFNFDANGDWTEA